MRKFNPNKELDKVQNKESYFSNKNQIKSLFAPLLVIACCSVSMIALAFSANLSTGTIRTHTIKIAIINGKQDVILNTIKEGAYREKVDTDATFGSLECLKGSLSYDLVTNEVYSDNITMDTYCILSYLGDGMKKINTNELNRIADNDGISYYFKGDSENNYVSYKGLLYRIVRINGDGTYRLILNQPIVESSFGNNQYLESHIIEVVNEWLTFPTIDKDYDIQNYDVLLQDTLLNLGGYQILSSGLLNVNEAKLINDGVSSSYLGSSLYLANGYGVDRVWAIVDGEITTVSGDTILPVRPVISVSANLISGQGTFESPYIMED